MHSSAKPFACGTGRGGGGEGEGEGQGLEAAERSETRLLEAP